MGHKYCNKLQSILFYYLTILTDKILSWWLNLYDDILKDYKEFVASWKWDPTSHIKKHFKVVVSDINTISELLAN